MHEKSASTFHDKFNEYLGMHDQVQFYTCSQTSLIEVSYVDLIWKHADVNTEHFI